MKNLNLKLLFTFFIAIAHLVSAQIDDGNAYLMGTYINVAIDGVAGKEGTQIGGGFHYRGGGGGVPCIMVSDTDSSDWEARLFHGDFFAPGTAENGFGLEINGLEYSNNFNTSDIENTAPISYADIGSCKRVKWQGHAAGVDIEINYDLKDRAHYYTTHVKMINRTDEDLIDLYYYRNGDPDNNQSIGGLFTTDNAIVSQPDSACQKALVSATQSYPFPSYIGFGGIGHKFKGCIGGFSNRSASDLWIAESIYRFNEEGDSIIDGDQAISLVYKTDLPAGDSVTFSFVIGFNEDAIHTGLAELHQINYLNDDGEIGIERESCAIEPLVDTIIGCPGVPVMLFVEGENSDDYNWLWAPTIDLSTEFGDTTYASPIEAITYFVYLGSEDCLPINPKKIVFKPAYNTDISDDVTIVIGESTTLAATGGDTYSWFPPDDLIFPLLSVTDAAPTETTEYNVVIGFDGLDCDDDTLSVTVFVEEVEDDLGIPTNSKYERISIYPNPFSDFTTINFGQELKDAHTIIIYDMLGEEVYRNEKLTGTEYKIKSQQLSSGTYLLSLLNLNKDLVFETKLLVK